MKNFTDEHDKEFEKINIYNRYKLLIPFVGKNYNIAEKKILFVGESHFLPETYSGVCINEKWYKSNQKDFNFNSIEEAHLNTRNILNNDVINSGYKDPSHSIYRNIGNVLADYLGHLDYNESLNYISFYNYFLRPAEEEGGSINVNRKDDVFSFNHLCEIENILKPNAIIFASTKARKSFHRVRHCNDNNYKIKGESLEKKIFDIPHPGSAWWNREFKININEFWHQRIIPTNQNKITGKDKLKLILNSLK